MTFSEALARSIELLERQGWVSYQTLRRRLQLDAATLDALKQELIVVRQCAVEENGTRLVWRGELRPSPPLYPASSGHLVSPTPPHLDVDLPAPLLQTSCQAVRQPVAVTTTRR